MTGRSYAIREAIRLLAVSAEDLPGDYVPLLTVLCETRYALRELLGELDPELRAEVDRLADSRR